MKKFELKDFSNTAVQADINFIKYIIGRRNITLIPDTGLHKLLVECEDYVSLPQDAPIYKSMAKPLLVLDMLSDTIKNLWLKRLDFNIQLRAMNSGTYEFGKIDPNGGRSFKDFELELFIASYLNTKGIQAELPQSTDNNDIFYNEIEIQCKHPEVFNRNQVDSWLRSFQTSLNKNNKHGVFCIGLDDYLGFDDGFFPSDDNEFQRAYLTALERAERTLNEVFDDTLRYCPKVLGIITISTHFTYTQMKGLTLMKTTNSVFCLRAKAKEVPEESHIQAYEVLSAFNDKPAIVHM